MEELDKLKEEYLKQNECKIKAIFDKMTISDIYKHLIKNDDSLLKKALSEAMITMILDIMPDKLTVESDVTVKDFVNKGMSHQYATKAFNLIATVIEAIYPPLKSEFTGYIEEVRRVKANNEPIFYL